MIVQMHDPNSIYAKYLLIDTDRNVLSNWRPTPEESYDSLLTSAESLGSSFQSFSYKQFKERFKHYEVTIFEDPFQSYEYW